MARIDAFLEIGRQQGGSDIHFAVGLPPLVRPLWMSARNSAQVRNPCSWARTNWASLSRNRSAARSPSTSAARSRAAASPASYERSSALACLR